MRKQLLIDKCLKMVLIDYLNDKYLPSLNASFKRKSQYSEVLRLLDVRTLNMSRPALLKQVDKISGLDALFILQVFPKVTYRYVERGYFKAFRYIDGGRDIARCKLRNLILSGNCNYSNFNYKNKIDRILLKNCKIVIPDFQLPPPSVW